MAIADNTPVIIAVSVILGVLLIALLVFLFVFCSRRMKRATNVRRRFIPGDEEERAIVRRAEPVSREIVEVPRPLPVIPDPRPLLIQPLPSPSPRPQHRVVTHEVIHHHHDPPAPPTPPPAPRALPEREPRNDWVLVRKVRRRKRHERNREESRTHSDSSSSGEEMEEEARMYGQFPRTGPAAYPQPPMPNAHPWQMMFYQTPTMPYQYNIGALDLAAMRPPAPLPALAPAPTSYEVSIPKRPMRSVDDSAIPDSRDGPSYNWGTARAFAGGAAGKTRSPKEYETRERVATYFEAEF